MPIRVQLGARSYDVHVGQGLLARAGEVARGALATPGTRATIIADSNVPAAMVDSAERSLAAAGFATTRLPIAGGEPCKTLANAEVLLQQLAVVRHERTDPIIAIGGGALCDLAGFVAATYRRGVPVIHCPTTLLAMVDASVGGKTGVNLWVNGSLKKNVVGVFWQPAGVIVDVDMLRSLPAREFRSGIAECLKHGLIAGHTGDDALWEWTLANLASVTAIEGGPLTELINRNVQVKATVVAGDEREEAADRDGGRALLNLGHTFGHVIESLTDLRHGECVGLGLIAAATASAGLGLAPRALAEVVRKAVQAAGLPTSAPSLPEVGRLIDLMREDKKTLGGDLRIVVPLPDGRAAVIRNPEREAVQAGWDAICAYR
ncbi:MAG TPA: 3-dehydroquinate synthase family protein [Phycisphaerales bacterium]|nr:3-dehydroquinate synthase family protein [Phycisphaerales bacterium]